MYKFHVKLIISSQASNATMVQLSKTEKDAEQMHENLERQAAVSSMTTCCQHLSMLTVYVWSCSNLEARTQAASYM